MTIAEKRRHKRTNEIIVVQYAVEPSHDRELLGVVANISESGLCLLTTHPLRKDDILTIKDEPQKHAVAGTAVVRWIDSSVRVYIRAGLELI